MAVARSRNLSRVRAPVLGEKAHDYENEKGHLKKTAGRVAPRGRREVHYAKVRAISVHLEYLDQGDPG
jgi:hypothetical protein